MSVSPELVSVLLGSALGVVGVASGIIYARQQVRVMRSQLGAAQRVSVAERASDLMQRAIAARKSLLNFASFREYEGVESDIQRVGGLELYLALRDNLTSMQEGYVLWKLGLLDEEWWNSYLRGWKEFLGFPPVVIVLDVLERRGILRSDFLGFVRELKETAR